MEIGVECICNLLHTLNLVEIQITLEVLSGYSNTINHYGELHSRTKRAFEEVCLCQEHALTNPDSAAFKAEEEALNRWNHLAHTEEMFYCINLIFVLLSCDINWFRRPKREVEIGDHFGHIYSVRTRDVVFSGSRVRRCRDVEQPQSDHHFQVISWLHVLLLSRFDFLICRDIKLLENLSRASLTGVDLFLVTIGSLVASTSYPPLPLSLSSGSGPQSIWPRGDWSEDAVVGESLLWICGLSVQGSIPGRGGFHNSVDACSFPGGGGSLSSAAAGSVFGRGRLSELRRRRYVSGE
ncbi:hypothetical protein Bca4012_065743 [Brassica carinata]